MRVTTCWKCGTEQDPEKPICCHLTGKKGGTKTRERLGREHYRQMAFKKHALRVKREQEES